MAGRTNASLGRRRLGFALRRLREMAGLTMGEVAKVLECSEAKLSRIETGRVNVGVRDVRDLLNIYGVTGSELERYVQIARDARHREWWQEYRDLPLATFVGYESAAASILCYDALLVPGLMQTEEYAHAVIRAVRYDRAPVSIEREIQLRLARQSILTGHDPAVIWTVIDESALRRPVGGREVMWRQLHRLTEVSGLSNVTLQVLPLEVGEHPGLISAFTVLRFSDPADSDIAYVAGLTDDQFIEDPAATRYYVSVFDHLRAAALNPVKTSEFLSTLQEAFSLQ